MKTNIVAQLNRYKELSAIVCNYADKVQKQTALSNILKGITYPIPDIISDNSRKIGDFGNFYFRNYVACPLFSAMCDDIGGIIHFVDDHIDEILLFENDNGKTQQERKRKSDQLRQTILKPERIVKTIQHMGVRCYTEVITEPDPDFIYSLYGYIH